MTSFVGQAVNISSSGTTTVKMTTPLTVGDLIVSMLTDSGGGPTSNITPLFTDTNTNTWNQPGTLHFYPGESVGGGGFQFVGMAWAASNATTPIISTTITNGTASIAATNSFISGEEVVFSGTVGTGAGQIASGTIYFVSATGLSGSAFQVSATSGGAVITPNASGTPTAWTTYHVSVTNTSTDNWTLQVAQYTGFIGGTPQLAPNADITTSAGSGTAASAIGFTNSEAGEVSIVFATGLNGGFTSPTGSFTTRNNDGGARCIFSDSINATSGNALTWGATVASGPWSVLVGSWYGSPPVIPPLAVRQACVGDSASTFVVSQGASFAEATLLGSTIFVVAKAAAVAGNAITGFADAVNGSGYQSLDFVVDGTAQGQFKGYVFQNAQSIGTAQALTVSASVSQPHLGFVAFEIQGTTPSSLAAHTAQLQTLATGAANAITSGTVQAGTGSTIAVAVTVNTTCNNTTFAPTVGTGFTICPSPGGNFWAVSAQSQATAEFQLLTNPGGMAATFTPPGATSDDYVTFLAVFNSIGGAFVPPFTVTQFFVNDQYIQS